MPNTTTPAERATRTMLLGAFCPNLAGQQAAFAAFEACIGRPVDFALAFTDQQPDWPHLAGIGWATADLAPTQRPVCWSVPMLPTDGSGLDLPATGSQNAYYTQAAQVLAAYPHQLPDGTQLVRIGWEFQSGYPWLVQKDAQNTPANYIATFRHMVDSFRAVWPGFRFVWCINSGNQLWGGGSPAACYPGDAYVDVIAADAYQQAQFGLARFYDQLAQNGYGVQWAYNFSQCLYGLRTGTPKPFGIAEWGVVNGGKSGTDAQGAQYCTDQWSWMAGKNIAFTTFWNGDGGSSYDSQIDTTSKPLTLAAFRATFGQPNRPAVASTEPVTAVLTASPDNTVVSDCTTGIVDAELNLWTLSTAGQVVCNGSTDTATGGVIQLAYAGGRVWQQNGLGDYYRMEVACGVPTGATGPTRTSPLTGPAIPAMVPPVPPFTWPLTPAQRAVVVAQAMAGLDSVSRASAVGVALAALADQVAYLLERG